MQGGEIEILEKIKGIKYLKEKDIIEGEGKDTLSQKIL